MPITFSGAPRRLTPKDMGGFDVSDALSKGFNLNKQFQEARVMPKSLAEKLLAQQLQNKINSPKAEHAEEITMADLNNTRSGTGLNSANIDRIRQEIMQKKYQADLDKNIDDYLSGNAPLPNSYQNNKSSNQVPYNEQEEPPFSNHTSEEDLARENARPDSMLDNNASYIPSINDMLKPPSQETPAYAENINNAVNPKGNPGNTPAERAKYLYDNFPQMRKRLKDRGYITDANAKKGSQSNTVKDIQALIDAKAGFVPGTDRLKRFSSPEEQQIFIDELKNAAGIKEETQKAMNESRHRRALGLKQGEDYVDNEGHITTNLEKAVAKRRPFSDREKKEQSGRKAFNVTYPFILKSTAYYSGKGALKRFNDDIARFDTDEKAHKRIVNYIAATQLVSQGTIKETATLGGANTNRVYAKLEKSLNASDLPTKYEQLQRQFRLPRTAPVEAGLTFQTMLNKSLKEGENLPAYTKEYINGAKEGHIYNKDTKKVEHYTVQPDKWDEFVKAGGY